MHITRRQILTAVAGIASAAPLAAFGQVAPTIHVVKDPNCGCCRASVVLTAPHLHFEIRDRSQRPMNPMLFGIDVPDSRDPKISELMVGKTDI